MLSKVFIGTIYPAESRSPKSMTSYNLDKSTAVTSLSCGRRRTVTAMTGRNTQCVGGNYSSFYSYEDICSSKHTAGD